MLRRLLLAAALAAVMAACSFPRPVAPRRPEATAALAPETPALAPSPTAEPPPTPTATPSPPVLPPALAGLRVAFDRDGALWLWQGGAARFLTRADYPAFARISDDGQVIAFVREGALWAIAGDGTQERALVSAADLQALEPRDPGVRLHELEWLPRSHRLAFNTALRVEYGVALADDLHLVNADTGERVTLLPPQQGGLLHPSPDGQRIAVVSPRRIGVLSADGSGYRTLLEYEPVEVPSEFAYYARPVWAADSLSLAVAIPPRDIYYGTQSPTTIWRLPVDGAPVVLSRLVAGRAEYISPDLARVITLRHVRDEGPHVFYDLYVGGTDGSGEALYYQGALGQVVWAPDGERFACWLDEDDRFYLGGLGAEPIPISEQGDFLGGLSWIDSSHFIYYGGRAGQYELRLGTVGQASLLLTGPAEKLGRYDFTTVSPG